MRWIFCLLMILVLLLAGCSGPELENTEIIVGSIQALTGDTSIHGNNVKNGIDLAVAEINAMGGIQGGTLRVIHEDDQCDPKKGISAAQKLITNDRVSIILGPTCSAVAMAVAPVAEEAKVILFTPIAAAPGLRTAGDYIFRNRVAAEPHSYLMAEFARNTLSAKTASVLYINLDNGIGYRDAFVKKFTELGGRVLSTHAYEKGASDLRPQLAKIKYDAPDVLYIAGQTSNEHAVRQAKEMGIPAQIIAPTTIESPELLKIAGPAAEGIVYSYESFNPSDEDPLVSEYQKRYAQAYGKKSEAFAANAYDATMLIAEALRQCGPDSGCVKDYLYTVKDYHGVGGSTTFDTDGEVIKPLIIKTVKNGDFVKYKD